MQTSPEGELTLQTVTFPADTNSSGDIFGGWVLSQMDIAAGTTAARPVERGHSCITQHFVCQNVGQRTFRTFATAGPRSA